MFKQRERREILSFQYPLDIGKMKCPLGHSFKICFITVLWGMNKLNHDFLCFSWNVAIEDKGEDGFEAH